MLKQAAHGDHKIMGYKSDHSYRNELARQAQKGLPDDFVEEVHELLSSPAYRAEKDEMDFDELLEVVREVMSNYPEWSWNGQRWSQKEEDEEEDEEET